MNIKILSTGDGHLERLENSSRVDSLRYLRESILREEPHVFVYCGDAVDSRNLKVETKEYAFITKYLKVLSLVCQENNVNCYYVKGTPSHDGDVVKRIIEIHDLKITYIDEPTIIYERGYSMLMLPEMYFPNLNQFYGSIDSLLKHDGLEKADICMFHGMFDFAIPQLKQIDSNFNQSRSIVINTDEFMKKYVKIVAGGGHVHSAICRNDCYYLGRFINEKHQAMDSDLFGFKLFDIREDKYHISNISNPYLLNYKFISVTFTKDTHLDDVLNVTNETEYDINTTVFKAFIEKNRESRDLFKAWKNIVKPLYVKKRNLAERVSDMNGEVYAREVCLDTIDIEQLVNSMYKEIAGVELPLGIVNEIFGREE